MTDLTFIDDIDIRAFKIEPVEPVQYDRLASGGSVASSLGDPYWRGRIEAEFDSSSEILTSEARLGRLSRPGQTFLAYDIRLNGPQQDIGGTLLTGSESILEFSSGQISLQNLPANYKLTTGDMIGWTIGGVRYMYRLTEDVTADSSGDTGLFDVDPPISNTPTVDLAVTLVRPKIKCQIVEHEYGMTTGVVTDGFALNFEQVFY